MADCQIFLTLFHKARLFFVMCLLFNMVIDRILDNYGLILFLYIILIFKIDLAIQINCITTCLSCVNFVAVYLDK